MAYKLRKDEKVSDGLKRVVKDELTSALEQLARVRLSNVAIHEVRKSIKKTRAVIQLVGERIDAGRADKRLRRAGRLLSPLRDADAVVVSARALCGRKRKPPAKTCSLLRDVLGQQKKQLTSVTRRDRVKAEATQVLRRVRREAKRWDWEDVGFQVLMQEVQRSYQDAKRAMRQAREREGPAAFHEWRKRVKMLWYALRLLKRRTTPELESLERLQTWLGDDHNLAVLRSRVARTRPRGRPLAGRAEVKTLAERRQQELRRRALTAGARVFNDPPKTFARRLGGSRQ
jgi:hypothetical protein